MRMQQRQGGFTLVEIAIVMVIIGLLLGGALKGQEMIENARTKRIKADFDQIVAAYYSYQDIYRALPGDNTNADDQHNGTNAGSDGGNRIIDDNWNSTTEGDESRLFWEHLRTADLIAGADEDQPQNAFGGIIGVQNNVGGLAGPSMCFNNLDARTSSIIDNQFDDGTSNAGTFRSYSNNNLTTNSDYSDASENAILCIQM